MTILQTMRCVIARSLVVALQVVWVESPSNPMMKLVDIASVAALVKKNAPDAIFAVDNTFMSPYFQVKLKRAFVYRAISRPLKLC